MERYYVIEKEVGETPLQALSRLRRERGIANDVPLSYAGRLDPMASGKLLILVGDECKRQTSYHGLDKEYEVDVLLGVRSDSGDVLGIVESCAPAAVAAGDVEAALSALRGEIELPYPHFSSKTVYGKPLHTWTLEGRLGEIEVPVKRSTVYRLDLHGLRTAKTEEVVRTALSKIDALPAVTEPSKALGRDFRRDDVRASWARLPDAVWPLVSFTATASSGTYMRSLAERLAASLGTCGLALRIHRTKIGRFRRFGPWGIWTKTY
ncbi:MAG TPA: hypothetical protein VFS75_02970 [Candidatus Paceibacterota bacterium]|nr:hypothetical protein [Candidatus Paceibacterota bacterium]